MTAHFHGCPRKPWPTFPSLLCFFMSPAPTCGVENGGGRGSRTTMPLKKNPSTCVRGYLIQRDGEVWCVYDPPDVAREPSQPSERTRSHPHRGSSSAVPPSLLPGPSRSFPSPSPGCWPPRSAGSLWGWRWELAAWSFSLDPFGAAEEEQGRYAENVD